MALTLGLLAVAGQRSTAGLDQLGAVFCRQFAPAARLDNGRHGFEGLDGEEVGALMVAGLVELDAGDAGQLLDKQRVA